MKIDASFIKANYRTDLKDGLYAEFSSDGQLLHFANYLDGRPQGWVLTLEPDATRARAERTQVSDYLAEACEPQDLDAEVERFGDWVANWIAQIAEEAEPVLRCSFCSKTQTEVKKLIAGPSTYICDECVALCQEIISESSELPEQA